MWHIGESLIERLDQIALRWMELVAAGKGESAEARALYAEFAALDRQRDRVEGHSEDCQAAVDSARKVAEGAGDVPDCVLSTKHSHPSGVAKHSHSHPSGPLPRRPGRKRSLGEFCKGQLAALLAVGFSLRESARLLRISRSTAQRAVEDDSRLQGELDVLAQQISQAGGPKMARIPVA